MNMHRWLAALLQFLILLPLTASCFLPAKNHMKNSPARTAAIYLSILLPCAPAAAALHAALHIDMNLILSVFLVPFFLLYRRTVDLDLPRSLAIYIGICAIETFPAQFAYALDARLHPAAGAANISPEAALFQLGLSFLLLAAFLYPAVRHFTWAIDNLDFSTVWYATVVLSSLFLIFNKSAIPKSYATLHTGRMHWLFPFFEIVSLTILITIYVLFYQIAKVIVEHARLKERSQLLEMQSRQYHTLQEHMRQTAELRHDFRHSVCLLAALAEKGDIRSIQTHLSEYKIRLDEYTITAYCENTALNAMFSYYHEMAVSDEIAVNWDIEFPKPFPFSELDMAALFGNLMENAIAGCQTVDPYSRYFHLTTEISHGNMLYIVSTNSFDGNARKVKGRYHSTKHSGTGTGLASITAVAEKYGGSAKASNSGSEFFVDAVLMINSNT